MLKVLKLISPTFLPSQQGSPPGQCLPVPSYWCLSMWVCLVTLGKPVRRGKNPQGQALLKVEQRGKEGPQVPVSSQPDRALLWDGVTCQLRLLQISLQRG